MRRRTGMSSRSNSQYYTPDTCCRTGRTGRMPDMKRTSDTCCRSNSQYYTPDTCCRTGRLDTKFGIR
ncbi:MAG: hypothetical protein QW599_05425 [Nitrososphaerota archaeon]